MNIENLNGMSEEELLDFLMKMKNDTGCAIKTFIIYKAGIRYKVCVDQILNAQVKQRVSRFEFPAPMDIRDEALEKFQIYNDPFSGEVYYYWLMRSSDSM